MAGKFKFIIVIFIFIVIESAVAAPQKRLALFFEQYYSEITKTVTENNDYVLFTLFLINRVEQEFSGDQVRLEHIAKDIGTDTTANLVSYCLSRGFHGFYFISLTQSGNENIVSVKLYDLQEELLAELNYPLPFLEEGGEQFSRPVDPAWLQVFTGTHPLIKKAGGKATTDYKKQKRKTKLKHNFPFINFSVNLVSVKIYQDNRGEEFSVFPIDLRLTAFPLKYLEAGAFCSFDYNNMAYKYYDDATGTYQFYQSGFNLHYGIFAGASFFLNKMHYSIGFAFYNILYILDDGSGWSKTNDINSYFLPQMAIYQKLDIKIFSVFNFSIYFNIKTMPMFTLKDGYFYSKPFSYDFIILEASILGFSITI